MPTQIEKAETLKALDARGRAFILANAWDRGSARLLTSAGFSALATTSAGCAFTRGQSDGTPGREAILSNAAEIVAATDLPVNVDLEDGFGDRPEIVADTIKRAIAIGLAGGSIEDVSSRGDHSMYDIDHAADRVRAAAEMVRSQAVPFQLVGRAENFLHGRPDLDDTIRRLQAFQEAGADVLYAPGLSTAEQIRTLIREVDRPVNVVMGLVASDLTVNELAGLGVARISVGGALARCAYGALVAAAKEMQERGTFTFAARAIPHRDINAVFAAEGDCY